MKRGFTLVKFGETQLYQIPSFTESGLVSHGFSTRSGGIGTAPYDTLNLAFHVGDNQQVVINNRDIVCRALGVETSSLITAQQVHGVNVAVVGKQDIGRGAFAYGTALPDTDGLITNRPGLLLATFYADCVPIFILDPVKKVVGTVHAGWKGTVSRIGALALKKMSAVFGSSPSDCLVGIGPSIGPCCYEVDHPVIETFNNEFAWWEDVLTPVLKNKAQLNLWEANLKIMVEAGIKVHNVELARICSCCNQQILFSYRGSQGLTGRMGAFVMLNP